MERSHCTTAVFRFEQCALSLEDENVWSVSFKRVAPRCEKTARSVSSIVALALVFIIVKSVHRPSPGHVSDLMENTDG